MADVKLESQTALPILTSRSGLLNSTCQRCPVCHEQLWSAKSHWIHRWLHAEKIYYECQICKQKFDEFEKLKLHQQKYLTDKGIRKQSLEHESNNGPSTSFSATPNGITQANEETLENGNQNQKGTEAHYHNPDAQIECKPKLPEKADAEQMGKCENNEAEADPCLIIDESRLEGSKEEKKCNASLEEARTEPCYKCDMLFPNQRSLQDHLRQVHNEKMFYPCVHCGETFACHSSLSRHIETTHKILTYSKYFFSSGDFFQHQDNQKTMTMTEMKRISQNVQVSSLSTNQPLHANSSSRHIPQSPTSSQELFSALPPNPSKNPQEMGTLKSSSVRDDRTFKRDKYLTNAIKPSIQPKEMNASTNRKIPLMTNSSPLLHRNRETAFTARKEFDSKKEEWLNEGGKISTNRLTTASDPSSRKRRSESSNVLKFHLNFPNNERYQSYELSREFECDKRKPPTPLEFPRVLTNDSNRMSSTPTAAIIKNNSSGYLFSEKRSSHKISDKTTYQSRHNLSGTTSSYQFSDKSSSYQLPNQSSAYQFLGKNSEYQLTNNIYPSNDCFSEMNISRPLNVHLIPPPCKISRPSYIHEYKTNSSPGWQSGFNNSAPTARGLSPMDWSSSHVSQYPKQGFSPDIAFSGVFRDSDEVFDASCCSCQMNNLHTRDINKASHQQLKDRIDFSDMSWHSAYSGVCERTLVQRPPREEIDVQIGNAVRGALSYENNWPYFTHNSGGTFAQTKQQLENNNRNSYYSGGNTFACESTFLSTPRRDLLHSQRIYSPADLQSLNTSKAELISNFKLDASLNNHMTPKVVQNIKTEIIARNDIFMETLVPVKRNSVQLQMEMFKMEENNSKVGSSERFKEVNNNGACKITSSEKNCADPFQKRSKKLNSKIIVEKCIPKTDIEFMEQLEDNNNYKAIIDKEIRKSEESSLGSSEDKINSGTLSCPVQGGNSSNVSIRCLICCALFMSEVDAKLHDVCTPEEIECRKSSIPPENE